MHHRLPTFLFACASLAVAAMRGQAPTTQMPAGLALVAKVTGTVNMTVAGTATALSFNDKVPQTAKINTGPESAAVLVFSNGATIQLCADTELILQAFLQDPFSAIIKVAQLKEEPSTSRTSLALNRGELIGNVKRLRVEQGSSFTVQTPVGAAGVRDGTFQIAFRPTGVGQAIFTLSTLGCEVRFVQPTGGTTTDTGKTLVVQPGQEIKFTVVTNADGHGDPESVTTITTIPPATLKRIITVTGESLAAVGFAPLTGADGTNTSGEKRLEVRPGQEIKTTVAVNERGQFGPVLPPTTTDAARPANENGPVAPPEDLRATTIQAPWKDPRLAPGRLAPRPQIVKRVQQRPMLIARPMGTANIGPMALDARWSNYAAYLQRMIETVQIQWERTLIEQKANPVVGSSVTVKFVMNDEGRIVDISVEKSTANEAATRACVNGITDRMPYAPWTDEMKAVLGEKQEMTFAFYYQ